MTSPQTLTSPAFQLERHGVAVIGTLPGGLPHPIMPDLDFEDLRQIVPRPTKESRW